MRPKTLQLSPTTTTTTHINLVQQQHWATDHFDEVLRNRTRELVPESTPAVIKISQKKKAAISKIMDSPGINNTERDNLTYEEADRNGSIPKFQSHADPPVQSHVIQSCVSTDDKNVSTDLQNFHQNDNTDDTTLTTTTVQSPTITTTTTPPTVPTITTPTPNVDTSSHNQRPVTNENLLLQTDTTPSRDDNSSDKVTTTTTTTPTLDQRLLVNTVLTKQKFTNIINEYSSNEPTNAVTTFILRNSL